RGRFAEIGHVGCISISHRKTTVRPSPPSLTQTDHGEFGGTPFLKYFVSDRRRRAGRRTWVRRRVSLVLYPLQPSHKAVL
ncbi:MAG: hypothetical protein ACXW4A_12710, partial [Nitrospira sp.]